MHIHMQRQTHVIQLGTKVTVVKVMFIPRKIHQIHTGPWSLINWLGACPYVVLYKRLMNINEIGQTALTFLMALTLGMALVKFSISNVIPWQQMDTHQWIFTICNVVAARLFSHLSVILFTEGHAWLGGGMHGGGCVCGQGACMAGGMCGRHAWQGVRVVGVCVAGDICGKGGAWQRRDGHCSERCASYWNAFLYDSLFHLWNFRSKNLGKCLFIQNSYSWK